MGRAVFIDVGELERKPLHFDAVFAPGRIELPENWSQAGDLRAGGKAELLDKQGARVIRVSGSIAVAVQNECARCLEELQEEFDADFELFFHPMETIARNEEKQIGREDAEIGFYEENGVALIDVVREQLLLWLPMRSLCGEDCKGICPLCGANWNRTDCNCREEFVDPRWETLRHMSFEN